MARCTVGTADDQIRLSGTTRGKPCRPRSLIHSPSCRRSSAASDHQHLTGCKTLTYVSTCRVRLRTFGHRRLRRRILAGGRFHDGHLHGPRRDRVSYLDPLNKKAY